MKKIFSMGKRVRVPDGTTVFSLLNCRDSTSGLPWDLLPDFSLAAGEMEPGRRSKIHVMPLVAQVTFVLEGRLEVLMKDPDAAGPYRLRVTSGRAVLTRPGTFLQLRNPGRDPCRVLYLVSPAYLFLVEEGKVVYDDSVVLDENWEDLGGANWKPRGLRSSKEIRKARLAAEKRLAERNEKGGWGVELPFPGPASFPGTPQRAGRRGSHARP